MTHAELIIRQLGENSCPFNNEAELQRGIEIIIGGDPSLSREVRLNDKDRIDFLFADGLGMEIKIKGSLSDVTRQLHRYAQSSRIKELLLVTTKARHLEVPKELNGKPVKVYFASIRRAF